MLVKEAEASLVAHVAETFNLSSLACKISDFYFAPKPWESVGLYEKLGLKSVKKLTPSELLFRKYTSDHKLSWFTLDMNTPQAAREYDKFTRIWESIHAMGIVFAAIYFFDRGVGFDGSTAVNYFVLIGNLTPVLIQRYNRSRVYRILERAKIGKSSSHQPVPAV